MVLEIPISPVELRVPADAWMPHHNGMADARASAVARMAHLDVIGAHVLQIELRTHNGIAQQGVQDHLEGAHDAADGSADDHQLVHGEANLRHPACTRLLLEEGQDARGQQREETIVPGHR